MRSTTARLAVTGPATLLLLLGASAGAAAQSPPTLPPDVEGARPKPAPSATGWVNGFQRWPTLAPERVRGMSPAAERAFTAAAEAVVDAIAGSAVVNAPPDTVCVGIQGSVYDAPRDVAPFRGTAYRFVVDLVIPGRVPRGARCGEGHDVHVRANDPGTIVRGSAMRIGGTAGSVLLDARGDTLYHGPNAVATVDGTTRYYARGRRWVILTRREAPLFRPVSVERYLTAFIEANGRLRGELAAQGASYTAPSTAETDAEIRAWRAEMRSEMLKSAAELEKGGFKAQADQMRATLESTLDQHEATKRAVANAQRKVVADAPAHAAKADGIQRELAEAARAQLAALSPAERAATACFGPNGRKPTYLAPCSDPWADRVVTINPDFLDRSLPPEAVQIITATTIASQRADPPGLFQWRRRVLEGLDYGAMMRVLR
jgi:hypothetical protein